MDAEPLYRSADLRPAYQLRYGWTAWPSKVPFPTDLLAQDLRDIAPEWEKDGLRLLESSLAPEQIQLTLSTTPQVAPVTLAGRLKGRIQHHCRHRGRPIDFSRKLAVRTLGDPTRAQVEAYIRNQVPKEALADERFRQMLTAFTVVDPQVQLSEPTETNSGRYWYNLHLVLVVSERYRIGEAVTLAKIRDTALRIGARKGHAVSALAVLPDHLHLSLRGDVAQTPEGIALSFLNNLAHVLDRRPWWQTGYYAGTFGEYTMAAVSVTGGIQEGILGRALTAEYFDSGLVARLNMAMPPKKQKAWTEAEVDPDTRHAYEDVLRKLLDISMDKEEKAPFPVKLTPEAKDRWMAFYNEWAHQQAGAEGEVAACLSKLEGGPPAWPSSTTSLPTSWR
jgi:REP element-mobilizing transposase RayT